MVILKQAKNKEKVLLPGKMVKNMMEIGNLINMMELALGLLLMAQLKKENSLKAKDLDGLMKIRIVYMQEELYLKEEL